MKPETKTLLVLGSLGGAGIILGALLIATGDRLYQGIGGAGIGAVIACLVAFRDGLPRARKARQKDHFYERLSDRSHG